MNNEKPRTISEILTEFEDLTREEQCVFLGGIRHQVIELRERIRVLEEQNRILREGLQYYATDTIWGCTDCAMHVHVWPGKDCRADISEDEFGYEKAQAALKAAEEVE